MAGSPCLTATILLGAFVLLDAYVIYISGLPFTRTIPCNQSICDFSVLRGNHLSDEQIDWLETLWNIRISNLELDNITELYYCGTKTDGSVSFYPCDIHTVYITLGILTFLPILLILCSLCPVKNNNVKYAQSPPEYNFSDTKPLILTVTKEVEA